MGHKCSKFRFNITSLNDSGNIFFPSSPQRSDVSQEIMSLFKLSSMQSVYLNKSLKSSQNSSSCLTNMDAYFGINWTRFRFADSRLGEYKVWSFFWTLKLLLRTSPVLLYSSFLLTSLMLISSRSLRKRYFVINRSKSSTRTSLPELPESHWLFHMLVS